jgi:hypothetical protein
MRFHKRYVAPILLIGALTAATLQLEARQLSLPIITFAPGDLFVSLETGPVQWYALNRLIMRVLPQSVPGTGEGMAFDAAGNLYVTRWCIDPFCATGDTGGVEKYDTLGRSQGKVGPIFNCAPHTMVFASPTTAYVGMAGCRQTIVRTTMGPTIDAEYTVDVQSAGVFWMDLGHDGCTMFYTSWGPDVNRYDVCGNQQLTDFNAAPLPGGGGQDLLALPDGSVLVSSGQVVVLLDPSGAVARTYEAPAGEEALWTGMDLVGDGTFWVGNYRSSNVYRFNLATGARIESFNTGTPPQTVVGIRVKR